MLAEVMQVAQQSGPVATLRRRVGKEMLVTRGIWRGQPPNRPYGTSVLGEQ